MSGILWVIIVGFVAGIIARLISPGPNNPSGFILTLCSASPVRFWRPLSARPSAITVPSRAPASSPQPSARWWCCSSGIGWWQAG
jgi:hypothetical protein